MIMYRLNGRCHIYCYPSQNDPKLVVYTFRRLVPVADKELIGQTGKFLKEFNGLVIWQNSMTLSKEAVDVMWQLKNTLL